PGDRVRDRGRVVPRRINIEDPDAARPFPGGPGTGVTVEVDLQGPPAGEGVVDLEASRGVLCGGPPRRVGMLESPDAIWGQVVAEQVRLELSQGVQIRDRDGHRVIGRSFGPEPDRPD